MRAHQNHMTGGTLGAGAFTAHEGGMSADWNKYSTPQQTLLRARKPEQNAIIEMGVGHIRTIANLEVLHTPEPDNRAHCDVPLPDIDEDLTEARFNLRRIARIVIPINHQGL